MGKEVFLLKKNMKILMLLLFTVLVLSWPIAFFLGMLDQSVEEDNFAQVDRLASELLALTKKGEHDLARAKLQRLAEIFPHQTLPVSIRIESLNAVTQSILAALHVFASSQSDDNKLLWHATQVRVAIDALAHTNHPIWRNYHSSYISQVQNLLQASVERDVPTLRDQFAENYRFYLALKPAMSVQLSEMQMEVINQSYELLVKEIRKDALDWQIVRELLRELNGAISLAFLGEDKHALGNWLGRGQLVIMIASVSTMVTMTLCYVAWRKYSAARL